MIRPNTVLTLQNGEQLRVLPNHRFTILRSIWIVNLVGLIALSFAIGVRMGGTDANVHVPRCQEDEVIDRREQPDGELYCRNVEELTRG